ncbi:MAG: carbon-phosphorus lyase complex subunit PhnI, partial [Rhodospirillaceae bacterium]|nr:carbon-phosphorus lyase complex subunit PhnI [Rhodospirillaceae bacterium]
QAHGDVVEAIFLLRAYRTTLPRVATSQPIDTTKIQVKRRISATFKDLPGGQILGPTFDYTHRLLDFALMDENHAPPVAPVAEMPSDAAMPRVIDILNHEGLIETDDSASDDAPGDLTREPLRFPAGRDVRLQNLTRGDEGFLLALAYSSQRGFGSTHPFAGEIRMGEIEIEIIPEELGFPIVIGCVELTECHMITQFTGSKSQPPQFTRGYGLTFGHNERKAMSMAIVDRALRANDFDEERCFPAQDEEFVLSHSDNVEASGFLQHLKLPHYVDFQGELVNVRALRSAENTPTTAVAEDIVP